jgi:kynureninase
MNPDDLYRSPNALAKDYSRFRVSERLLLTGHSHQAWPDRGFDGQHQAWLDAAELVDDKWPRAFEKVERVRQGYARLLGEPNAAIAFESNTLHLVARVLSALPLKDRPKLVTTDGEFHTIRRLLSRLAEEGVEVVKVAAAPVDTLAERLKREIDDRTAAALCSSVLFQSARIVPGLAMIAAACARHGAEFLIDAYHQMNVVPFDGAGLEGAFVVGGGYKYCQLGEGVCFLRIPPVCNRRPVLTGWFAEFDELARSTSERVEYGEGAARFSGATFDPTSFYRAAAVFEFFESRGLKATLLRDVSRHQVGLLAERFDAVDLDPSLIRRDREGRLEEVGGFLVLWSPLADEISRRLKERGVWTDFRGEGLRLGPAPYLSDARLIEAVERLAEVCRLIERSAKGGT